MPREKQFGESVNKADTGDRLVRALSTARKATPPIEWRKYCVNGSAPAAQFQNQLHEATNQAMVMRSRQIFAAIADPTDIPAAVGTTTRYRFAFRTGTYHSKLVVFCTMQPPLGTLGDRPSFTRLKIFSDTVEAVLVSDTDFHYGASPNGIEFTSTRGWSFSKVVVLPVTGLSADTDYYARFDTEEGGSLQTATVIEMQSMTESFDGYLPTNLNQESEVLSIHRERVATIQKNLWKHSGQHLVNWTVYEESFPKTNTTSTSTNVIDGSSTTVSAATPGFTLNLTNKDRRVQPDGIPVVMKVFCETDTESLGVGIGRVRLLDSSGSAVMAISGLPFGAPGWVSVTGFLPATEAKYDLHFDNDGGNEVTAWAAFVWEYEA